MNGVKYLLDTNFILGILKSNEPVLTAVCARQILASECAYSAITRMELLGFPGITSDEDAMIRKKLEHFSYVPLTRAIEDRVIDLRQRRKVKLPDAIIAATALDQRAELLTLDQALLALMRAELALTPASPTPPPP